MCSHTFSHIVLFFIGTCSHKFSLILKNYTSPFQTWFVRSAPAVHAWSSEVANRKLIQSSDVVFNEDSILSRNQQKIVGKRVSFEIAKDSVEGSVHHSECTEENEVQVDPATPNGPLSQLEEKDIKDKAKSTHVKREMLP